MKVFNYIHFIASKLCDKNSNLKSHVLYLKYRFFSNRVHVVDEVIFDKNAKIVSLGGFLSIGDYLRIKENSFIQVNSGRMGIGDCVFINRNCTIICREKIMIGDEVSIGPNVIIWDHDHMFDENMVYGTEYKTGEIIIEKGCWIGAGAIILRNTRIGEGSVIGAGAVVKGNIPPHSLVTSNRDLIIRPIENKSH